MEIEKEILEYELIDICIDSSNYQEGEETAPSSACDVAEGNKPAPKIKYDADGIPMGNSIQEIKLRKQIIFQFYEKWKDEHPDKSVFNKDLQSEIFIKKESVVEAAGHSPRRYKSTLAVLRLDEILTNAIKIDEDKPKPGDKNQEKLTKMIVMSYQCPELGLIKLTVGVRRRSNDKVQYGITALEEGETIGKNKASHKK